MQRNNRYTTSVALVFNKDKQILLTQRHDPANTHSHLKWQFPGGGIEFGEQPQDAAIREVQEEVSITCKLLSPFPITMLHPRPSQHVDILLLAFLATYISGDIDVTQDDETGAAKWYTHEESRQLICLPLTHEIIDLGYQRLAQLEKEE